mmetsp:Transcript_90594/g.261028  ORF Transcript_90594/g.261028 Transcript_90594/m.261028 type:complete len:157 (-) Transcript_90594:202-672(-)
MGAEDSPPSQASAAPSTKGCCGGGGCQGIGDGRRRGPCADMAKGVLGGITAADGTSSGAPVAEHEAKSQVSGESSAAGDACTLSPHGRPRADGVLHRGDLDEVTPSTGEGRGALDVDVGTGRGPAVAGGLSCANDATLLGMVGRRIASRMLSMSSV